MRTRAPRVMIAGTNSGSGKTTITCGILKLLLQHRRKPVAFKCGPDYIDPMFHRSVLEMDESNLDLFLFERELAKYLIVRNMKDGNIGVIEGVMGFYDGVGEDGLQCSTYEVAKSVNSPVIIIVPSYGLSTSALAIVKGFLSYQPDSNIKGVIFNQMHRSVYENIKQIWDNYECEGEKPQLLGYVESIPEELQFESRHLGLITAMEIQELKDKLDKLANILDKTIDIEKIISIAESAEELEVLEDDYWVVQSNHEHEQNKRVRIAIAKDQAKKLNGTIEDSIVANDRLYAGYPHIHFYSNLQAARNYIDTCRKYKK